LTTITVASTPNVAATHAAGLPPRLRHWINAIDPSPTYSTSWT
jgi:hypothetical protein